MDGEEISPHVRSEGMSYGMMIAVQLNKKEVFDNLWRWTKTYMWHQSTGKFAWKRNIDGSSTGDPNDEGPAPDAEEYFAIALFFAAGRWGNFTGIDYEKEANDILHTMVTYDYFETKLKLVVFSPEGPPENGFTNPSYHLPAFYTLWSKWADENREFWQEVATRSRDFLITAESGNNQTTGLTPDFAEFDGTAREGDHRDFGYDAWRVAANIAFDYSLFGNSPWANKDHGRLLRFFYGRPEGIDALYDIYSLQGDPLASSQGSAGLKAMNAVACLAVDWTDMSEAFVNALWNHHPIPEGNHRYYNGLLYMLGLLHASGNFKVYAPRRISPWIHFMHLNLIE